MGKRAFIFNTGKNHRMIVHLNTPPLPSSSSLGGFTLAQPCHHKGHLNAHLHTLAHRHDRCRPQQTSLPGVSQSGRRRARFMIWKPDNTGTKKYCLCTFFFSPPHMFSCGFHVFSRKPKETFPCGNRNKLLLVVSCFPPSSSYSVFVM